jgi:hypothetical protein
MGGCGTLSRVQLLAHPGFAARLPARLDSGHYFRKRSYLDMTVAEAVNNQ